MVDIVHIGVHKKTKAGRAILKMGTKEDNYPIAEYVNSDMIDYCQEKSADPSSFFLIFHQRNYFIAYLFQLISRDGIVLTTVDHSDIRGLCTALHVFVVELPRSNFGSWANDRFQESLRGFSLTVIASLIISWKYYFCFL